MLVLVSLPEGKVQLGIFGNGSGGMDQGAWIISLSDVWIMAMDWGHHRLPWVAIGQHLLRRMLEMMRTAHHSSCFTGFKAVIYIAKHAIYDYIWLYWLYV